LITGAETELQLHAVSSGFSTLWSVFIWPASESDHD